MILQLTKKAQAFVGAQTLLNADPEDAFLCWHVNLFYLNGKKSLLITHTESLYSVFLYSVTKKELPSILTRIKTQLIEQMYRDNFSAPQMHYVTDPLIDILHAKTSNRSVLGTMNDMVFAIKTHAYHKNTTDAFYLSSIVNHTPYKRHKYAYTKDEFKYQIDLKMGISKESI